MSEWRETTLGDHASIQTGPFGSQLHASDYVPVGIPSIMPKNIGARLEVIPNGIAQIKESDAVRLAKYRVSENDIVYSRRGDVEKCAFITTVEEGWLCGTGCIRVRFTSKDVDPMFVALFLSSAATRGWISGNAVGTIMPNLNTGILKRVPLTIPSLSEQQAIAGVLSSLDDKIDLLHRQNKTLEALAETLFRQWFVEEATELVPITEYVDFNPIRKLTKGTEAPYLNMASVSTSTFCPQGWYDRAYTSGMKFQNGDTLLARITPCLENGKSAFVTFLADGQIGWGSTEFIVMRSRDPVCRFFTYALARNQVFRDYAEGCMAGSSGRQRVDLKHLVQFEVAAVGEAKIMEFNTAIEGIPTKLNQNMLKIRTLENLRDTLLPKLMSGEVRVEL